MNKKTLIFCASALVIGAFMSTAAFAAKSQKKCGKPGDNIIAAVVSAPVVSNGLVANQPTEINILFTPGLDAAAFGHQIPAGGRMEVELGGAYTRNPEVAALLANANVIMTIAPQNPIVAAAGSGVQHGNWSLSDDGDRVITITPSGGDDEDGLEQERAEEVGFKVVHIRPRPNSGGPAPFYNGDAGEVGTIEVRIYDAEDEVVESGFGDVVFEASVGRQVHITNAGLTTGGQGSPATTTAELVESTVFQRVEPNTALTRTIKAVPFSAGAPYAPRFLLFEAVEVSGDLFIPQDGIADVDYVVDAKRPHIAHLQENGVNIGIIMMSGPHGKSRGAILPSSGATPALSGNGSILNVPVQVGSKEGIYTVKVKLSNGGKAVNTIIVEDNSD